MPFAAPQGRSVVCDRQDGRRGIAAKEPQCDSAVHRCPDRDGLDTDWYDQSCSLHPRKTSIDNTTTRIENVAIDLESFSKHAGRTTVMTDDVLLLARRNSDLHGMIKDFVDKQKAAKANTNAKGKGRAKR